MIHGKKMLLVPHESVAQLQNEIPKPPAPVGSYSKMDADMAKILSDKQLNKFDKYVQYESVLQRYMSKLSRQKKDVAVYFAGEDEEEEEESSKTTLPVAVKEEKKYAGDNKNTKGALLFNVLSKSGGVDIDADGVLIHKGKTVGYIDELIDAAQRNKKNKPEGWNEFSKVLKAINIPTSFVNNNELKKYIKDKAQAKAPTRKLTRGSLRWAPYNGPNK